MSTADTLPADRFVWVPREQVETPPENVGICAIYRDFWWAVNDKGEVAYYGGVIGRSPQCNMHRRIAERVGKLSPDYAGVVQIPVAFVPHRCEDYR